MKIMKTVTFTFDAETIETLTRLAQAAGKSRSEYLRELVHAADRQAAIFSSVDAWFPPRPPATPTDPA